MDIKIILLAIIVFVLFVMMGRNPYEVKPEAVVRDPFRKSLEERLADPSKKNMESIRGNFQAGYGQQGNDGTNNYQSPPLPYGYTVPSPQSTPQPIYEQIPAPGTATPQPGAAPSGKPASPFDAMPSFAPGEQGGAAPQSSLMDHFTLKSGARLAYSGDRVYTLSENGERATMKDGYYTLKDGTLMIVRDGKRQVPLYPVGIMAN